MFLQRMRCYLLLTILHALFSKIVNVRGVAAATSQGKGRRQAFDTDPENIHAIIVSSSRYWFNYRHAMNALGMYSIFRQNGIPDENLILMIADEYPINPRNPFKNRMHAESIYENGWYNNRTEIDYRGSDVTIQNFFDSLLGLAPKSLHNLNEDSNLVIYLSGHGGNQFFKFQDEEEIMAQDISNLMNRLYEEKKFKKALFIADTCQAFTIFDKLTTPNVMALGTSLIDQNAYAHHTDNDLGLGSVERWTYFFIENYRKSNSQTTLHQIMVSPFANRNVLLANVGIKDDMSDRKFKDTKLAEFFGVKGGRKRIAKNKDRSKNSYAFVETSSRSLHKLPQIFQEATSTVQDASKQNRTTNVCSVGEYDEIVEPSGKILYFLLPGLLLSLMFVRKMEKTLFEK
mmetsp:Transcript_29674/g.69839  ORF Transcript_29674/g.69839 Transcript_29674/m.69839 type:complete len:401 (+) Transcript_29674:285-1487(+)